VFHDVQYAHVHNNKKNQTWRNNRGVNSIRSSDNFCVYSLILNIIQHKAVVMRRAKSTASGSMNSGNAVPKLLRELHQLIHQIQVCTTLELLYFIFWYASIFQHQHRGLNCIRGLNYQSWYLTRKGLNFWG
jgi:hypothetical protein